MQGIHNLSKYKLLRQILGAIVIGLAVFSGLIFAGLGLFFYSYNSKIYPGVHLANFDVGGLTQDEVVHTFNTLIADYKQQYPLRVIIPEDIEASATSIIETELSLSSLAVDYQLQPSITQAYEYGRQGSFLDTMTTVYQLRQSPQQFPLSISYDQQALDDFVSQLSQALNQPAAPPEIIVDQAGQIEIFPGQDGIIIDEEQLVRAIETTLKQLSPQPISLPLTYEPLQISANKADLALARAQQLLDKSLTLELDSPDSNLVTSKWTLAGNELVSFIDFNSGFDHQKLNHYLTTLADGVNREPQDAVFEFTKNRVTAFSPAIPGLTLEIDANVPPLVNALNLLESNATIEPVTLAVASQAPKIDTQDINDLGIQELIGRGQSTYKGSIAGRVHNVALTASRLHGVLVPPGETFSFNQTIGEVSRATGYQSAYVIKDGRTVLGDGGGVCQDSTTLFRAIMDAGLPITERKAHSYRVGYYEQNSKPGFDATVFSPSVDLKFTNDTPGHILIQAKADSSNLALVIELYGTDDGRTAEITNYSQWNAVPAPPPLYQDDPTLEPGVVKQVDWASPGLNVKFDYIVTKAGETHFEKTFYSNYRPWQAVFLRGV